MMREIIIIANHVQIFIGIDAELTSPQVEKEWRILFVHPLYKRQQNKAPGKSCTDA